MPTCDTRCCVAGGGPAGMMLGLLLARAGLHVTVLEKHADFLRDFRGDTIHPSTLEVIHELGLLDSFLARPHQKTPILRGFVGDADVTIADFTRLPTHCKFLAFMPQWDFLDFLAEEACRYPGFELVMNADVDGLIDENGRVLGVRAMTPGGPREIRTALVVGADGRGSDVRRLAGLQVKDFGAPIDVLWMRISRRDTDPVTPQGRFDRGRILVMIYRGDYWQLGFVIPKGGHETIRARGLPAFRAEIAAIAPMLADRVGELTDWEQIRLLTVKVDRLVKWWKPGLLMIGDAAHAMSPVGGVGINLAIQDAVAAANLLTAPLRRGEVSTGDLQRVQRRRWFPTAVTQALQVIVQNRVIGRVLASREQFPTPRIVRLMQRFPVLQQIPARLVGLGLRPEHVRVRGSG